MKSILTTLTFLVSTSLSASPWTLTPVNNNNSTVGYIYHTDSMGTRTNIKPIKEFTSLRFICSLKGDDPIVAVFWNTNPNYGNQVLVSAQTTKQSDKVMWDTDSNLLFRTIQESDTIIRMLKSDRLIKFSWTVGNTQYVTSFNTDGFSLTDFDTKCK